MYTAKKKRIRKFSIASYAVSENVWSLMILLNILFLALVCDYEVCPILPAFTLVDFD